MKTPPLHTFTVGQHTVNVYSDPHAENPRTYDNAGLFLVKGNRHFSGDHDASADDVAAILANKNNVALPVYAYVHSGVALATAPFSCPWDSGMCGVIYIPWEEAKAEGFKTRKAARAALEAEIQTYSAWLAGDVFGYDVLDPKGECVDSCWGFYGPGMDYCVEEATHAAEHANGALCAEQMAVVDAFAVLVGGGQ